MTDEASERSIAAGAVDAAFERAGVGLSILDEDGRFVRVNRVFAVLHGMTPESLTGRGVLTAIADAETRFRSAAARAVLLDLDTDFYFVANPGPSDSTSGCGQLRYRLTRLSALDEPPTLLLEAEPGLPEAEPGLPEAEPGTPASLPVVADSEAVLTVDGRSVVVAATTAATKLLARPARAVIGRRFADLGAATEAVQLAEALSRTRTELRLQRGDGSTLWVLATRRTQDMDGEKLHLVTLEDRNRHKRDELLLHEAFDAAPRPFVMVDSAGLALSANEAWRASFAGARPADAPLSMAELLDAGSWDELCACLDSLAAGESRWFEIHAMVHAHTTDPRAVLVSGSALHDLDGNLERVLLRFDDETDRAIEVESARIHAERVRATMDYIDVAVMCHDTEGTIHEINLGAHRMFGTAATDFIGERSVPAWWRPRLLDGSELEQSRHPAVRVLASRLPMAEATVRLTPPGSGHRWFIVRARPATAGAKTTAVTSYVEVTEQFAQLQALSEDESDLRGLFDDLPIPAYSADTELRIGRTSTAWVDLVAETDDQGEPDPLSLVHPLHRRRLGDAIHAVITDGEARSVFHRLRIDGPKRWVEHRLSARRDSEGAIVGIAGALVPTPDWVAESDRSRRLIRLVETTNDLVGEYSVETDRVTYLNPRAMELFVGHGADADRVQLADLYKHEAASLFRDEVWPALQEHGRWEGELPMLTADGRTIEVQQWVTVDFDETGNLVRFAAAGHDVSHRSQRDAELLLRATHDGLTGLPNRALLLDRLGVAIGRAERTGQLAALVVINLDRFELLNRGLGRDGADRLLVAVADRLVEGLRPGDTVARLGGDEFAIVSDDVEDATHSRHIAQAAMEALVGSVFDIDGDHVVVTASIGVALSGGKDQPETVLRDAAAALYRSKDLGGARIELFDETMRSNTSRRLRTTNELRSAVGDGAIVVHYQPTIDLRDGTIRAVEALARWQHPERGLLSPSEFIEIADSTGMVLELGIDVLRQASRRAKGWLDAYGDRAPIVNVNLSPRQVADPSVSERIAEVLTETGLPPKRLCLELTETVMLDDTEANLAVINQIRSLGVSLAIDDFGTGYSSLSYLNRLPVDVVKLDKSFVDALDPEQAAPVASAIISLAHQLGLTTVAEGVTTVEQLATLHRLGCETAQGYYFSPPLDGDAIERYLERRLGPHGSPEPSTDS